MSKEYYRPCSNDTFGYSCPSGFTCRNPLDFGYTIEDDGAYTDP